MTTSQLFKDMAAALRPHVAGDTYALLHAVDAVERVAQTFSESEVVDAVAAVTIAPVVPLTAANGIARMKASVDAHGFILYPSGHLLAVVRENRTICHHLLSGNLIRAVVRLREVTGCSLRAAKEACEEARQHALHV